MVLNMAQTITITPNYKPHPKQILLHNAPVSYDDIWIILYGGARGGGKSAGALADAFLFAQTYPGAKICILRESLDAAKQSFLDKLPTLFPQEYNGIRIYEYRENSTSFYPSRCILFPNGSYITIQRVANYQEAVAKQGWEFNYLIIDECTKQEERTLKYLLSCVRSATTINRYTGEQLRIPTKVLYLCNPGGIGHKYIKENFIDPSVVKYNENGTPVQTKDTLQLVDDPRDKTGNKKIKLYTRFIPATYEDNPYLNDSYVAMLLQQPEYRKKMDLYGNWNVVTGKMFDLKKEQIVYPRDVANMLSRHKDGHLEVFISIDWGYRPSYHSAHWYAVLPDHRVIVFKEIYGQELVFEEFVAKIRDESKDFHISATCLPHDMFREGDIYRDKTGKIIGETKADVFEAADLSPISVASGKGKVGLRYDKIHSAMTLVNKDGIHKFLISGACTNLLDELEHAVHNDYNPEEIDSACKDHAIDDFGLFLVYYSDDIEPLGFESVIQDNRSHLQRLLEEDEKALMEKEEDDFYVGVDNLFDL